MMHHYLTDGIFSRHGESPTLFLFIFVFIFFNDEFKIIRYTFLSTIVYYFALIKYIYLLAAFLDVGNVLRERDYTVPDIAYSLPISIAWSFPLFDNRSY